MEEIEYNFIKHKVRRLINVDLNCYKSQQVQRRLSVYLMRSGHPNWPSFFRSIQDDPVALGEFKDYLTINVSSFFRDTEKFDYLREAILPRLLRQHARLRVWSAGCSRGHEPYSLAIMLCEVSGIYSRHLIRATDIDRSALEWATAGGPYSADDVANVPPDQLGRYFRLKGEQYYVIDSLRRKVAFLYQNMLSDPFEGGFDLIVCRNVVIYFEAEAKRQLYRRFHEALRPGGVLFIGGTEVISKPASIGLEPMGVSFYLRADPEA